MKSRRIAKPLRMLYVGDVARDYATYSKALRRRGWWVERACNPPEALERLAKSQTPFDAVLIDRKLTEADARPDTWEAEWGKPDFAGDLLLDRVVAESPYICPIMLTVFDEANASRELT